MSLTNAFRVQDQVVLGQVQIGKPGDRTLQQTFSGRLSANGFPIDTFPADVCAAQYVVHASDGVNSSSSNLVVSVDGTTVNGSMYGDTTTGDLSAHLIDDIGAEITGGNIRLTMHGVSGDVVIFGVAQMI